MLNPSAPPPSSPFANLDPARQKLAYDLAAEKIREIQGKALPALAALQAEMARRMKQNALCAQVPPLFQRLWQPARYKGVHGGRGSAKSWSFGTLALDDAQKNPGLRIVCIREVQKSLEQSVKRLLEDLIQKHDLGREFRVLNTHIETPGGGIIIFQGMQNHTAESIKSLEGYDRAWVEEAQSLSARSLMLLRPTIRKTGSELWFSWNPRKATDPVDDLLRSPAGTPPGSIVFEATYKDNPYLPQVLHDELTWDMLRDIEKYNHIWLGQYERHSEARVFKNWRVEPFETPVGAQFLFGGDWGFATDPDVLIRAFVQGRELYVDYEAYKVGCEIEDTPALFDSIGCTQDHIHGHPDSGCEGMARAWEILTDPARPETISYMQRHGYPRVIGAKKGPGSIEEGIKFLKNYDIVVHPRCRHTIDELTMYSFKVDRLTGVVLPVLQDKKNHVIDSLRYTVEKLRNPQADWVTW